MVVEVSLVSFDEGFDDVAWFGCSSLNAPEREPSNVFDSLADCVLGEVLHFQGRYVSV